MESASLRRAAFNNTIIREASLQDADLTDPTGLLASQLSGTNVSGVQLPNDIAKFDGLVNVEEISKKAGKLFTLFCNQSPYFGAFDTWGCSISIV